MRTRIRANLVIAACLAACATCDQAVGAYGWAQPTYGATIATHFSGVSQAQSGSTALVLNHDGAATIQASVAVAGDEVLASATSDTLTTSYKLTGAVLGGSADGDWVSAAAFILPSRTYSVSGTGPSDITFWVQGVTAAGRANDAGAYTGSVILTVTW